MEIIIIGKRLSHFRFLAEWDTVEIKPLFLSNTYLMLFDAYKQRTDFQAAKSAAFMALDVHNSFDPIHPEQAASYHALSLAYAGLGDLDSMYYANRMGFLCNTFGSEDTSFFGVASARDSYNLEAYAQLCFVRAMYLETQHENSGDWDDMVKWVKGFLPIPTIIEANRKYGKEKIPSKLLETLNLAMSIGMEKADLVNDSVGNEKLVKDFFQISERFKSIYLTQKLLREKALDCPSRR